MRSDRRLLPAARSSNSPAPPRSPSRRRSGRTPTPLNPNKRRSTWRSRESARSRPAKGRPTGSPARSASTRCSRPNAPARAAGASVTFEPGARTAWHTHPLGQTLIITAGCGWVQREGGPVEEVHPGDVVWFPPGEKHWHGATPTTAMTHIAIQEALDGKVVDWLEHVSDEQYRR